MTLCLNHTIDSGDGTSSSAMWCDKYKPTKSQEMVGNKDAINGLKQWLVAWRSGAEKREYLETAELDCDSRRAIGAADELSNTVLITGPSSCGKTASVYAVAAEMSYAVIEVNCVVVRSAKDLRDLIGEATQS